MEQHIISTKASLKDALERINRLSGGAMTLMAVDDRQQLRGTLTDGDIRRALLAGLQLTDAVSDAMLTDFKSIDFAAPNVEQIKQLRQRGIRLLPALDTDGRIVKLIDLKQTTNLLPVSALIMAGGKGERLRPLTLSTPKPLLEIGGHPIIDHNVRALAKVGITDITVSINYLADQMRQHFAQPVEGVEVKCVDEATPLGTIGILASLPQAATKTVLVMNSDLLTDVSFEDMYLKHVEENADITVAAIPYTLSVPYAILQTDGNRVMSLEEKPVYSYYANAGIYMVNPAASRLLKPGERADATDLIESAIDNNLKITYFPINGTWIDVGTPADFNHAREIMKYHRH